MYKLILVPDTVVSTVLVTASISQTQRAGQFAATGITAARVQVQTFKNDSSAVLVKVKDSMDAWGLLSLQPAVSITQEALRAKVW